MAAQQRLDPAVRAPALVLEVVERVREVAQPLDPGGETALSSVPVTVESEEKNYDADLGFVLRKQGVYPAGFGKYDTQNWVRIETYKE